MFSSTKKLKIWSRPWRTLRKGEFPLMSVPPFLTGLFGSLSSSGHSRTSMGPLVLVRWIDRLWGGSESIVNWRAARDTRIQTHHSQTSSEFNICACTSSGSVTSSLVSVGALTTITVWSLRFPSCLMSWYVIYAYVEKRIKETTRKALREHRPHFQLLFTSIVYYI